MGSCLGGHGLSICPTNADKGGASCSAKSIINWPTVPAGTWNIAGPIAGTEINTNIVNNLRNIIDQEIDRYTLAPARQDNGNEITLLYTKLTSSEDASSNTVVDDLLWEKIVRRVNDIAKKRSLYETDINNFRKEGSGGAVGLGTGEDLVDSNNINEVIAILNAIKTNCACHNVCKCNIVCSCNGNCGCNYSDERLKENIKPINPRLMDIFKPVEFNYKNENNSKPHYGILAQQMLGTVLEDTALLDTDEWNNYKVNYIELIGIMMAEIKDLRQEIEYLKNNRNNNYKGL